MQTNPLGVPAHQHQNGGGWVADTATVDSTAYVGPDARVYGNAYVFGNACVYGNACVSAPQDYIVIGPIGSEDQFITLARTKTGHTLTIGCWENHTVDELAAEVQRRAPLHAAEYAAAEVLIRARILSWETQA